MHLRILAGSLVKDDKYDSEQKDLKKHLWGHGSLYIYNRYQLRMVGSSLSVRVPRLCQLKCLIDMFERYRMLTVRYIVCILVLIDTLTVCCEH